MRSVEDSTTYSTVQVNVEPGFDFVDQTRVELRAEPSNATIYYTLDGTPPGPYSTRYEKPFMLKDNATLRACALVSGFSAYELKRKFRRYEVLPDCDVGGLHAGLRYALYQGNWERMPYTGSLTAVEQGVCQTVELPRSAAGDHFAVVFEGLLRVHKTAAYTFSVSSDDGCNLLIDGRLVVNNDGLHGPIEKSGTIGLEAGLHSLWVEYFEATGDESLEVKMGIASEKKEPIPAGDLFHAVYGVRSWPLIRHFFD